MFQFARNTRLSSFTIPFLGAANYLCDLALMHNEISQKMFHSRKMALFVRHINSYILATSFRRIACNYTMIVVTDLSDFNCHLSKTLDCLITSHGLIIENPDSLLDWCLTNNYCRIAVANYAYIIWLNNFFYKLKGLNIHRCLDWFISHVSWWK